MSNLINNKIVTEIDELVAIAEKLSRDSSVSRSSLGPDRIEELSAIASRGGQTIQRLYGQNSQYSRSFEKVLKTDNFTSMHSNSYKHISEFVGILKGVQHDIKSGLLSDFRRLLQAEVFADFLEMAEHILSEGYKDAAAVLLGAIVNSCV
jgi:hypothetical protein